MPVLSAVPKPEPVTPSRPPLDWADLATKQPPERKWAIKGWLGFGHVTLLVGQGGIGKTLLTQQMLSCLAIGKPFIGNIDEPRRCLMWACEDDHDELWRRQIQIAQWCNAGLEAFSERLTIVPRHGLENTLMVSDYGKPQYTTLLPELAAQARDLQAEVVALDNVGQLFGGGENDRHAVTAFLNALSGALAGLAILLLAHPSRSLGSEFSGSSAWENVARTRLYLGSKLPGEKQDADDDPEDHVRYLARRKSNYSQKDWRRLTYKDGALTPEEPDGGIIASIRAVHAERIVLAGIKRLAEKGVYLTDGQRSPNYLPKALTEYQLHEGANPRDLLVAMRSLVLNGQLVKAEVGKRPNRAPLIALVVAETDSTL